MRRPGLSKVNGVNRDIVSLPLVVWVAVLVNLG